MFAKIDHINIAGISSCTPGNTVDNYSSNLFDSAAELENYIKSTAVRQR